MEPHDSDSSAYISTLLRSTILATSLPSPGLQTNFSRPFPSPDPAMSTFQNVTFLQDNLQPRTASPITADSIRASNGTPTRQPQMPARPALGHLSMSSSRLNIMNAATNENGEGAAIAANRLIDFTRGAPPGSRHALVLSNHSPRPQTLHHKRRLSSMTRRFTHKPSLSQASTTSETSSTATEVNTGLGGRSRPIMHFRPRTWKHVQKDREELNIDLFWPIKDDEEEEETDSEHDDIFPLKALQPLCEFRNLKSLKLSGMLQSYQKYIWQTCWLNPGLEDLALEMALAPELVEGYDSAWSTIDIEWTMMSEDETSTQYLGYSGEGCLHGEYGYGEYLDKESIAMAKFAAASQGCRIRYLPVVKLTLLGFVVDAGPMKWFDPRRLRQITFRHGCFDAGLSLPGRMADLIKIDLPMPDGMKKFTKVTPDDIKVVTLKKGKVGKEAVPPKPKHGPSFANRWFSTKQHGRKQSIKENTRASSRLRSTNSMSSLEQTPNSGASASMKSQEF